MVELVGITELVVKVGITVDVEVVGITVVGEAIIIIADVEVVGITVVVADAMVEEVADGVNDVARDVAMDALVVDEASSAIKVKSCILERVCFC